MRHSSAVACLFALGLAIVSVQAEQDDDDGDGGATSTANELAQQVSDEYSDIPALGGKAPAEDTPSDDDVAAVGPTAPQQQAASAATTDVSPATVAGPTPVSMMASVAQRHAAAPAQVKTGDAKTVTKAAVDEKKKEPTQAAQTEADAKNAHIAAETAKNAAKVATKIAKHSVHMTEHAKSALKDAHDALHKARVDSAGLSKSQKHDLKQAEAKLKEATKSAEFGEVKNAKYVKAEVENKKLQKMEKKMDKIRKESSKKKHDGELEAMRKEIEELRKELKEKEGDKAEDDALLQELGDQILKMEEEDRKDDHKTKQSHDELKAEIERLRAEIKSMDEDKGSIKYTIPKQDTKEKKKAAVKAPAAKEVEEEEEEVKKYDVRMKPLSSNKKKLVDDEAQDATPVESKGIDIDTAMPYGDLEPFGREDTAQELTENSIQESNAMVDQLEKAEVAEEKRSVFRALTRLRGAAITSFDGVARSQTGNIDEYNKIHKWRSNHPLHHLADEESDISKWAFPENAD
jgi:hypothetical protein